MPLRLIIATFSSCFATPFSHYWCLDWYATLRYYAFDAIHADAALLLILIELMMPLPAAATATIFSPCIAAFFHYWLILHTRHITYILFRWCHTLIRHIYHAFMLIWLLFATPFDYAIFADVDVNGLFTYATPLMLSPLHTLIATILLPVYTIAIWYEYGTYLLLPRCHAIGQRRHWLISLLPSWCFIDAYAEMPPLFSLLRRLISSPLPPLLMAYYDIVITDFPLMMLPQSDYCQATLTLFTPNYWSRIVLPRWLLTLLTSHADTLCYFAIERHITPHITASLHADVILRYMLIHTWQRFPLCHADTLLPLMAFTCHYCTYTDIIEPLIIWHSQ